MASLTDTLSAPSGGKPIISSEVASPDYFGAAAGLLGGYLQAKENKTIYDAKQATAQDEANKNSALSEVARGAMDIMSGSQSGPKEYVAPSEIKGHANKVARMQRANLPSLQVDAELQALTKKVMSKYPDQADEIYKWMNDQGFDDFMFRDAKMRQKTEEAELATRNEAFDTAADFLVGRGVDITTMSRLDIIREGSAQMKAQFDYDDSEKRKTDAREAAQEERAAGTWNAERAARIDRENEEKSVTAQLNLAASTYSIPQNKLFKLAKEAQFNPAKEKEFRETVQNMMLAVEADRAKFNTTSAGYSKAEIDRGNAWFDSVAKQLKGMYDGDMSSNSRILEANEAAKLGYEEYGHRVLPNIMLGNELFGLAYSNVLTDGLLSQPGFRDRLTSEVVNGLAAFTSGRPAPQIEAAMDAIAAPTPEKLTDLKTSNPAAYDAAIQLSAATASLSTPEMVAKPTPEGAKGWNNSIRVVLEEAVAISPSTPTDKHIPVVLKNLPPGQMVLAINNYANVTGDALGADALRSKTATAYFNALNAGMKDYTSNSIGSMLSPLKTSANMTGMGGGLGGKVKPRVEYDTKTGRFVMNGPNQMNIWTGSQTKNITRDLNALLDGIVILESQRTDSKAFPAGTTEIARRNAVVDWMNSGELMDQVINLQVSVDSWNNTVSPVLVLSESAKLAEEAKARIAANPTGASPKEKPKTEKKPEGRQTLADAIKIVTAARTETPKDDPFYKELETVESFINERLNAPPTKTGSFVMGPTLAATIQSNPEVGKLLSLIDAKEGKGDYNKLYDDVETSEFSNVKVSEMTINELLKFNDPESGDYGTWAKSAGISAAPMGRYQIIRSTLKSLKEEMGLTGDEVFTPELQDQMFLKLLERSTKPGQNIADTWVALKGTEFDRKN